MKVLFLLFSWMSLGLCAAWGQPSSQSTQAPPSSYVLQPGDSLEIFYRLTPDFNQVTSILPDGNINLRLLGAVRVAGLTVIQAREAILTEAQSRLKNPEVSITVLDFVQQHFIIIGEVGKPGRYELHGPTNAIEALAIAGGFTTSSSRTHVILVRPLSANSEYGQTTLINFKDLNRLKASAVTKMPAMLNGDILIVTTNKATKIQNVIKLANVGLYYNPLPAI